MTDINLTQEEADALIALEKVCSDDKGFTYLAPGGRDRLVIPLLSLDKKENFLLDIGRGKINFSKVTYQNRARGAIVLMRLDLGGGAPHRNPDGEEIACPHLHICREGFGDKWAPPVPMDRYRNLQDHLRRLVDFMTRCQIVKKPKIQAGLF